MGCRFDKSRQMEGFWRRLAESGLRRVFGLAGVSGRFRAARLLDGPAQDELDLPVEATQIVVRPALEGLQQGRVDTKKKRLSFSHATY